MDVRPLVVAASARRPIRDVTTESQSVHRIEARALLVLEDQIHAKLYFNMRVAQAHSKSRFAICRAAIVPL